MTDWYDAIGKIHNKREYKDKYFLMKTVEGLSKETNRTEWEEFLKAWKKRCREYLNADRNTFSFGGKNVIESWLVKDEGIDGYVELVHLPKHCTTYDEAKEFFDEYLWLERPHSMYDCTGELFTCWRHIFKRNGEYYAYHSVARDV